MDRQLRKRYLFLLLPAATGFVFVYSTRKLGFFNTPSFQHHAFVPSFIFILAALFAIALPNFYRSRFAHVHRHRIRVSAKELTTMELRTISLVMTALYLALLAYGLNLPRFHLYGTILMALYAVYYFYPSRQKLDVQKKMYRITT
jgi:uncharacterized membrane protein